MTKHAGSFDAAKPDWRGVIRNAGYPWYVCYHRTHSSSAEARQCAREALAWMKEHEGLPDGWITYESFKEFGS